MNKIIICKYVNATVISNTKFTNSLTKQYTQITDLRRILDVAAKELNFNHLNDWYNMPTTDYPKLFEGSDLSFEKEFKSSPFLLMSSAYPEHNWLPWKFEHHSSSERAYTSDMKNARQYMDWAAKQLNVKEMRDWYKVSSTDFSKIGGKNMKYSYTDLLIEAYPEYDWLPWKFDQVPKNYWNDINNVRQFMNWAAKQLNVKQLSDWYKVSSTELSKIGGTYLLQIKSSYIELLTEVYPEYNWVPWKFEHSSRGYWGDINNVRKYMDWTGKQLNVKELNDWYNIPSTEFMKIGGKYLLKLKSTYIELLTEAYPEYNWIPWKFNFFSPKSLITHANRRQYYVKWMAKQLNIKEISDWYKITAEQIIELKGGILIVENRSLPNLLSLVYPEHKWDINRFEQQQHDIWTDFNLANYFVGWLKKQSDKEISVLCQYVKETGSKEKEDVLTHALQESFPKKWIKNGSQNAKKSQFILKECIEKIFNKENTIIMEEYKHPDVVNLELDYFLPQYNLAFEYQGQQHYKTIGFHHRQESVDDTKERDKAKVDACNELGITLIEVPYWWDRNLSSLACTIFNSRPDLFDVKPQGNPIPSTPPQKELPNDKKTSLTHHVLMTATVWENESMEPKGWYMTEKYDGIRFYWDGTHCYSRQGTKINIPTSLAIQLPPVALDGELWTQYGLHQDSVSLMSTNNEEKWSKAIFWIFDAPKLNKPLEERIEFLQQLKLPSFAKVVEFVKCEGKEHLNQFNKTIIEKGGEGVILREPGSMYTRGRSPSLRKYKPYFDAEVRVLRSQYPQGFTCEQLDGKIVFVKTETSDQAKSIKKGDIITVKHNGTNVHGTLQYPQFYRKRLDSTWSDLLNKIS